MVQKQLQRAFAAEIVDGRCGADPWGCPAGAAGDLGPGIDPWGRAAPSDEPTNAGDLGPLWDPWG